MAEITAKLRVRQGNLSQLPRLSPGEFGYAKDTRRLFIGNEVVTFTGDGVTTEFNTGVDLDDRTGTYFIDIDGQPQQLNADFTVENFVATFNEAPDEGQVISFSYNTEVMLTSPPEGIIDIPVDIEVSNGEITDGPVPSITIDTARFGSAKIRYSMTSATDRRNGVLDISLDSDINKISINDSYTENTGSTLDHVFGKSLDVDGKFILTVTTTESTPVRMTWVGDHFAVGTV